jgi:hypothetical protein
VSAGIVDCARFGSVAWLRGAGFEGFHSVSHLRESLCLEVPVERGVYVVVRDTDTAPEFLPRSVGGWYRHEDPTVGVDTLEEKWVDGAPVLYVGRARGPGVRSLLQQRVKRFIRFGQGKVVAHRGGRLVWQLRDHRALQLAWRSMSGEPASVEAGLLEAFVAAHGRLPFANLPEETSE